MESLDELRKRLFRKGEKFEERSGEPTLSPAPTAGPRSWENASDPALVEALRKQRQKRIMRITLVASAMLGVAVLAAAAVFFVFLGDRASVSKENIFLVIEAPQKITVGEQVTFDVRFENRNTIPLESVDLIFEYPEGARPVFGELPRGPFRERISIGRLLPNEEQRETFTAFVFGREGDTLEAQATLEYRPQNSSARFGKDVPFALSVERSPIGVAVTMPEDATSGQQVEITIDYVSTTESLLENVSLDIAYPSGFEFISATPAPAKDTTFWHLGDIPPGGEGSIIIQGTITGNSGEGKFFAARVGLFDEATDAWSSYGQDSKSLGIRDTLLAVAVSPGELYADGAAPGRTVPFTIQWRNNLPVSARNVVVEATLSGEAIDYARVRPRQGSYNSTERKVVWTASTVEAFRFVSAGQSDVLTVDVPIKRTIPVQTLQDKNFIITVNAVMFTNTVPEGFAGVETSGRGSSSVNVITELGFVSRSLHRSGEFANTGSLPPRVGQETTYTVMWSLTSSTNDVDGAVVRASLPAYVEWKGTASPAGEQISYDFDTREVVWNPGFIVAGTGYTRPAREVSFQIGLVPGVDHIGQAPLLTSAAMAFAKDTFTGFILEQNTNALTTQLRSDPAVTISEYNVVP